MKLLIISLIKIENKKIKKKRKWNNFYWHKYRYAKHSLGYWDGTPITRLLNGFSAEYLAFCISIKILGAITNRLDSLLIYLFTFFFNETNSYETTMKDRNRNSDCNFEIIFFYNLRLRIKEYKIIEWQVYELCEE